jgi:hypothetical protein
MKIEIKKWIDGSILFTHECEDNSIKLTVKAALKAALSLRGADLSGADLRGADLSGADLSGAVLRGAVLRGAVLSPIRDDYWLVLLNAAQEIPALREALVNGKVDGSVYDGACACLVGTIANARKCCFNSLVNIKPNSRRPIERFFLGIDQGDTPETSQFSKLAVQWLDEFVEVQKANVKIFAKQ